MDQDLSRVRRAQARATERAVGSGDPGDILKCAREALELNDEVVREHLSELRRTSRLACAEGCSHCCHIEVSASFPEMAHLARFIENTFDAESMAALRGRIEAHCAELEVVTPRERAASARPCVLLVAGRCSAYEARPLACRGWNSADVAPCIVALASPGAMPSVPVHRFVRDAAIAVSEGISEGVRAAGLDDSPLDLPRALRALLGHVDELAPEWLEGRLLASHLTSVVPPTRRQGSDMLWRAEDSED